MKTILSGLLIFFILLPLQAQERQYYRLKKKKSKKHIVMTPEQNGNIVMLRVQGYFWKAKTISYLDTLHGYQIVVPDYLEMWDSDRYHVFSALFPRIGKVSNAVSITSFNKEAFDSWQAFREFIIENPNYGEGVKPAWSENHTFIEIEKLTHEEVEGYKVKHNFQEGLYHAFYVLIESPRAYLWANFVATPDTYETNIGRFTSFIRELKFIEGQ